MLAAALTRERHNSFWISAATVRLVPGIMGWKIACARGPIAVCPSRARLAPRPTAARAAAEEEVAFAESLCGYPPGTVLALSRSVEDGAVRERFRTLHRREGPAGGDDRTRLPVFGVVEVEGEDEGPVERPDLAALARGAGEGGRR